MQVNKDPAFLLYSNELLSGMAELTMEERGQYITLLCLQHQKGHLSEKMIRLSVGNAAADVMAKFRQDSAGLWYNARLEFEIQRRAEFAEQQRKRAIDGWKKRKNDTESKPNKSHGNAAALPVENTNENEIKNLNDTTRIGGMGERTSDFIDVDGEIVTDVLPILEYYEAQLNGTMRENGNIAWRALVSKWFSEHIGESFKDRLHVKNSFKKFYLTAPRNGKVVLERNIDHL